jgi:sulfotransferase family protein
MRGERLVESPVFLLSSVRSGSTLLRVILDTHSQICSPHELHLRVLRVSIKERYGVASMKQLGLDERKLEHLLWDRLLHRELTKSGKTLIVDKTPNNLFMWQRLPQAWAGARFIFLLRHPAGIVDSLMRLKANQVEAEVVAKVKRYTELLTAAQNGLPGLTVKYEELTAEPERVTREICDYLSVPWERGMLDYGTASHGPFKPKLGDWSPKIRSGQIDSNIVLPSDDEVPEELREASRRWGYVS